ncbi:hypothetical protein [Bacteroidetes bacterium endosymbiont of Geopemphigus sp.]|uniref:hypothetical protein n=1 Tax=Bacteroidetes bacterium endosymbiont of Geopemphigus sp. TaxID=2047937 RepID=UPI000CD23B0F|nr:hypothetical protein [Bacteroidetes bacterium endosymbiont of Geopemphigus sp.]
MHKYFKILITFSLLIGTIFAFKKSEYGLGIFFIFLSAIPVFLFFRNEYLLLGFFRIRKQDMEGLGKWLGHVKNPKSQLIKSQRAYYYFLSGILTAQSNITQSEKHMKKALEIGLKFKHDRAMAKLNLSAAALSNGHKRQAEILLSEARDLDSAGILSEQIKMMREQMKRVNIGRNLQNPNMRQARKFF